MSDLNIQDLQSKFQQQHQQQKQQQQMEQQNQIHVQQSVSTQNSTSISEIKQKQNQIQQEYEQLLKQIIETEKNVVELNNQYQNLLNESSSVVDTEVKSEYRGRLIEVNDQIKKNNDKLYILKKKEQHLLNDINDLTNSVSKE
ncbi:hypothetical protein PPERSA_05087 [Pseudocohnilembus persalinus]|uniref:Uncharacterized protein n=1 Tax=Pseudocohnilembus persalinus TaxID=266149 RepID=A0A0V0QWP4_PSEPJ|nr:hypothetical protein PPERSA_05087 [Pseudocohnilembus persalinus]|eukprot:KRX06474.1 hypothetical protein PPERSA_05087 [Pseudocohnilembus persalinus]